MAEISDKFKRSYLFLFAIWPFFAVLTASMSKNKQVFVFIWTLFFTFFGYTFIVAPASDGMHYKMTFIEISNWVKFQDLSFSDLLSKIYDYYPDPYVPLASYFVAVFTNNWHMIFSVYGLVLGFFFSQNIFSILQIKNKVENKKNRILIVLGMIFLIFLVPIWEINGVRMWTACHFFIFYFFKFSQTGEKKYFILFNLAGFFHASFMLVPLISVVYYLINFIPFKLRLLLVLTVVLAKQSGTMINPQLEKLEGEGALVGKFNTYNDENYIKSFTETKEGGDVSSNTSWFVIYNVAYLKLAASIIILIILFILWVLGEDWLKENESYARLVRTFIALSFVAYLMSLHPSPSASRFIKVAGIYSSIVLAYSVYAWETIKCGRIRNVVVFPLGYLILFVLVVQTRFGFENFNSAFIFGNPLYVAYQENPRPLIELYHSIFGAYGGR